MYYKNIFSFLTIIFCFTNPSVFAEDNPTPMGFSVNTFEIAPGTDASFEEVSMKFKAAADKLEGIPPYFAFSPAVGNDGVYAFASPFASFTDLAAQRNVLAEAYDEEEVARLISLVQKSVVKTRTFIVIPRPDLGIPGPESDAPPEITLSLSITVKPDMADEFQDYMKKLIEATKATDEGTYWSTFQPGIGAGRVWAVRIATTWQNLDTPAKPIPQRLTEHFGNRAGEEIYQVGQDTIENIEVAIERYRADLSHIVSAN